MTAPTDRPTVTFLAVLVLVLLVWSSVGPRLGGTGAVSVEATPTPTEADSAVVELLAALDARDERIAEMRDLNAEVLADNAHLDRLVAAQADEIEDLADRLAVAEGVLANVGVTEAAEEVVVGPPPPPPPAPAPAPAPVAQAGPPNQCSSPHGTYTVCVDARTGEYRCRDDVTWNCGRWWSG